MAFSKCIKLFKWRRYIRCRPSRRRQSRILCYGRSGSCVDGIIRPSRHPRDSSAILVLASLTENSEIIFSLETLYKNKTNRKGRFVCWVTFWNLQQNKRVDVWKKGYKDAGSNPATSRSLLIIDWKVTEGSWKTTPIRDLKVRLCQKIA